MCRFQQEMDVIAHNAEICNFKSIGVFLIIFGPYDNLEKK